MSRESSIYRVTIFGGIVNALLLAFKFAAGILGHSSAMVADAVHSLSDFLTDIVVLVFVRVSNRPADRDHEYGHGKYETLATVLIALSLLVVGVLLAKDGVQRIISVIHGVTLPAPRMIALWAALASIVCKEICYQVTAKVGRTVHSDTVIANAWHHRSDALSSVGTGIGIAGAIFLGEGWTILDPIAGCLVSLIIIVMAIRLAIGALGELLEHSLPEDVENRIIDLAGEDEALSELHHLRTRKIGNQYAIEMHVRMPGDTSLYEAHQHSTMLEQRLKKEFGPTTHITIHIEPTKLHGEYREPCPC